MTVLQEYKGVRAGLEFHQRLATSKLFCHCSSELKESQPLTSVSRSLRPVAGELGVIDPAALAEFYRGSRFTYQVFHDETCLVELDEEPPHQPNSKALDAALEISLLLGCQPVDEVHVMRKTIIDGSAVSGFQRTSLIASGGSVDSPAGPVPINGVYLEEDASGIVGKKGETTFRLDRLGIPLVEIATGIMQDFTPAQVREVALGIGRLLRVTGRVQRGIGSIRQDVNISIPDGERIEIKGFQEIGLLEKAIEYEVRRQRRLIALREHLRERGLKPISSRFVDFSKHFQDNEGFIGKSVRDGGRVLGYVLPGFSGVFSYELTPGRHVGSELADHARQYGFGGLVDSDEKPDKYKAQKEWISIGRELEMGKEDAFLFIVGKDALALKAALNDILERINFLFRGVPRETRQPLEDGNSAYMRPLAGAARLYPETDLPPIVINHDHLEAIRAALPRKPDQIFSELTTRYRLSEDLATALVTSPQLPLFLELADWATNPTIVANTLLNTLTTLRREGLNVSALTPEMLKQLFIALKENRIAKEAIPQVLRAWSGAPKLAFDATIKTAGAVSAPLATLDSRIRQLIKAKPDLSGQKAFNVLMGDLMKEFRGRVDGSLISKKLREALGL